MRRIYARQGRGVPEIEWASDPAQGSRRRPDPQETPIDPLERPRQAWCAVRSLAIPGGPVRACNLVWWLCAPAFLLMLALVLLAALAIPAVEGLLGLAGASPAGLESARFAAARAASALTFVMAVVALVEATVRIVGGSGRWSATPPRERRLQPPSETTPVVAAAVDHGARRLAPAANLALSAGAALRARHRQRGRELVATAQLSFGAALRLMLLGAAFVAARPTAASDAWSLGLIAGFGAAFVLALAAAGAVVGEPRRHLPRPPDGDDGLVIALGGGLFTVAHLMLADYAGRWHGLSSAAPLGRVFADDQTWLSRVAELLQTPAPAAALLLVPLLIAASLTASTARWWAGRRAVNELRLFARAYEAGVSLCWATERRVVLVPRPRVRLDGAGRLHHDRGAAVRWRNGRRLYYWHGVRVPAYVVRDPARLTIDDIDAEPDPAVRRAKLERYGEARYFDPQRLRVSDVDRERDEDLRRRKLDLYGQNRYWVDSGARRVAEDRFGALYHHDVRHAHAETETVALLEVRNTTPEPDGTHRLYYLRVPPHVATPHEAVAWTFGLTAEEYAPIAES